MDRTLLGGQNLGAVVIPLPVNFSDEAFHEPTSGTSVFTITTIFGRRRRRAPIYLQSHVCKYFTLSICTYSYRRDRQKRRYICTTSFFLYHTWVLMCMDFYHQTPNTFTKTLNLKYYLYSRLHELAARQCFKCSRACMVRKREGATY